MRINLVVVKDLKKYGYPLKVSISAKSKNKKITIPGLCVSDLKNWDTKKNLLKFGEDDVLLKNERITEIKNILNAIEVHFRKLPKNYHTIERIEAEFNERYYNKLEEQKPEKQTTIFDFCVAYEEELSKKNKIGSARTYQHMRNQVFKYISTDLKLDDFNHNDLVNLEASLLSSGRSVNTVAIYLRHLRAIFNRAIDFDLLPASRYPFKKFKIKEIQTSKKSITEDDFERIFNFETKNKKEELAKDIFILSVFLSGMNFGDLIKLKKTELNKDVIIYYGSKSKKPISVIITEQANEIMSKYALLSETEYIFPFIKPNLTLTEFDKYKRNKLKKINTELKLIGKDLGFNIPLTTYVANNFSTTQSSKRNLETFSEFLDCLN